MERWYALRMVSLAIARACEHAPQVPVTGSADDRRVDELAGLLVQWATNRIDEPGRALVQVCEALGLRQGSRVFDRLVRLFA